jgi:hypothetical protein
VKRTQACDSPLRAKHVPKTLYQDLDERIRKEAASIETHATVERLSYEGSGVTSSPPKPTLDKIEQLDSFGSAAASAVPI